MVRRPKELAQRPVAAPPPPFDPELAPILPTVQAAIPPGFGPEMIPAVRAAIGARLASDDDLRRDGRIAIREVALPGGATLLIATPTGLTDPAPAIYHVHGGGMIMGSSRGSAITELLDWAEALGAVVVAVDYRLAPEHPHPAPVDDCTAGLAWTLEHAGELGVDPDRVVLAGFSAGGALAGATALRARAAGGPVLRGLMLLSPMLDDRNDTLSAWQMVGLGLWDRQANTTGWTALLGDRRGHPDVAQDAAPARAPDLGGLPPTFLDVGSAETFRDETVAFASRMWAAGGRAELHVWPGGFHSFDTMVPTAVLSGDARTARLAWLRRLLGAETSTPAAVPAGAG